MGGTYEVSWSERALNAAAGFLRDDAEGLADLMDRIDDLSGDPRPVDAPPLGSPDLRRLHTDRYRALYEVDDEARTVTVIHLGRLG
jgi:mRNA interferase RelE/StbE